MRNHAAVYQIFTALHDRHVEQIGRLVESTLIAHASSPPEGLVRALMEAMVEAHAADPALHELLSAGVPHGARGGRACRPFVPALVTLVTLVADPPTASSWMAPQNPENSNSRM